LVSCWDFELVKIYMIHDIHQLVGLIPGEKKEEKYLFYINNSDGTPRWIWPAGNNKPDFLRFYNISTFKAKAFVLLVRVLFKLRIQSLVFKKVILDIPSAMGNQWALFTGTKGIQRKMVFYRNGFFSKIPVGMKANSGLLKEKETLELLFNKSFNTFDFPKINDNDIFPYSQTAYDQKLQRSSKLLSRHAEVLKELYDLKNAKIALKDKESFCSLRASLMSLCYNDKMPSGLHNKLLTIYSQIDNTMVTDFGFVHGDFTPWNMYFSKDKIFLYDWESVHQSMPRGFDHFHFIIQQGILIDRMPWEKIYEIIVDKLLHADYALFDTKENLDHYLKLYLLYQIDRSMKLYVQQTDWHMQIYWMIDIWNAALDALTTETFIRAQFISSFFDHLQPNHYAGLKISNTDPLCWKNNSDVDILINQKDIEPAIQFCKKYPLTAKVSITSKSFMTNINIFFKDGSFLSLDLIHQLKRKTDIFMDAEGVLKRSKVNEFGIKTVSSKDEAKYIGWFYALNNAAIPNQYKFLHEHLLSSKSAENKALLRYFKGDATILKELKYRVKNKAENLGWSGLKNKAMYFFDSLKSFLRNDGLVITFSGVDGAGKSTIIENIKYKIEKSLRKEVVVLRHRPSILPIISALKHGKEKAEAISVSKLPRTGNNDHLLSSLLRFGYYYTDYIIGQFYIYFKFVMRGKVVLYDRYYFDFINDSKRSNILLPSSWVKFGYRFLLKPDLNYFLYADANTIISRKQELDIKTIESLTTDYKNLFAAYAKTYNKSEYFSIKNEKMDETLSILLSNIKSKVAQA